MRSVVLAVTLALLTCSCIGWTDQQKDVVDSYMEIAADAESGNWDALYDNLSEDTQNIITEIITVFEATGAPLISNHDEFLAVLALETQILNFSESVHSVEFAGERAVLAADGPDGTRILEFREEHGKWKLNLSSEFNAMFALLAQGVEPGGQSGPGSAVPSFISSGAGSSMLLVRNRLNGLAIHNVFCSLSTSESWGEDLLGPSILGTGSELGINIEPGTYDIQVYDSMEHSYTLWQIEVDQNGFLWEITAADMDEI